MIYIKNIQSWMKNEIFEENSPIYFWHQFISEYHLSRLNVEKENFNLDLFCNIVIKSVECMREFRTNFSVETDLIAFIMSKVKKIINSNVENLRNYLKFMTDSTVFSFKLLDLRKNSKISEILKTKNQVTNENTLSLKENQIKIVEQSFGSEKTLKALILTSFFKFHDFRKTWNDLLRLTNDEDSDVRFNTALALGSAFPHLDVENLRNYLRFLTDSTVFSFKLLDLRKNSEIGEVLKTKNQVTNKNTLSLKENQIKIIQQRSTSKKTLKTSISFFNFHDFRENLKVDKILTINLSLKIKNILLLKESKTKTISEDFTNQRFLMKVLTLRNINQTSEDSIIQKIFTFSLANSIIRKDESINIAPEICRKKLQDNTTIDHYFNNTISIIQDLQKLLSYQSKTAIDLEDLVKIDQQLHKKFFCKTSYVTTFSPYPNQKDCNKSIKLEDGLLYHIKDCKNELENVEEKTLQNKFLNFFSKYKDRDYIKHINIIEELADEVERKTIVLKRASSLEKLYYQIVRDYFGVIYLYLTILRLYLVQSKELACVLNQTFFIRKHKQAAKLLSGISRDLHSEIIDINFVKRCPQHQQIKNAFTVRNYF